MITVPKMLRLLLGAMAAMITMTCIAGFPAAIPMNYPDQLVEMHTAFAGDEGIQKLLEELIGLILSSYSATAGAAAAVHGAGGGPTSATEADQESQTCTGSILSSDLVQDIQYQQSNRQYIVVNGAVVHSENPLDLYIELFRVVTQSSTTTDVWFSHVPCAPCINYMDIIFGPFTVKPVLHVESLQYDGSNYKTLRDLGCLARLRDRHYKLKTWDWDMFSTKHDACSYYSASRYNTDYIKQKIYTSKLTTFLEGNFSKSSLGGLCDSY